jgi:hypothetical protein
MKGNLSQAIEERERFLDIIVNFIEEKQKES